jgi:hypothetical protein
MERWSRDVRQEPSAGLVVPGELPVRIAAGIAIGKRLACGVLGLRRARRHVEHRHVLGPVLLQVSTLNQLGAQGWVYGDVRSGREVKRPEKVACGNEREVTLNLGRPHVGTGERTAGEAIAYQGGNDRLPAL